MSAVVAQIPRVDRALSSGSDGVMATPKADLLNLIFNQSMAVPEKGGPSLSEAVVGTTLVAGDVISMDQSVRGMMISLYRAQNWQGLGELFSHAEFMASVHAFGTVTGINAILGAVEMKHQFSQIAYADAIGDQRGSLMGRVSFVKGVALAGSGISFLSLRPLAIAKTVTHASAKTLLGRAINWLSFAGVICYTVFFSLLAIVLGIQIHEANAIQKKVNQAESLEKQVEMLQKLVKTTTGEVWQKLVQKEGGEEAAQKALIEEAYLFAGSKLEALAKELNIDLPKERLHAVLERILRNAHEGGEDLQANVQSDLLCFGLIGRVKKTQEKKLCKLQRVMSQETIEALQNALKMDLLDRVQKAEASKEAKALVEKVQATLHKGVIEKALIITVVSLGIAVLVMPYFLVSASGVLISTVAMLIFSTFMLMADSYYLVQSHKNDRFAVHDKKMLILSTVLGVSSLIVMAALGFSGVISFGLAPAIISLVLGLLWVGQNGLTWWIMDRNEKRNLLNNPTLESFIEAIESGKWKEKIDEMYGNLPEEMREKINAVLKESDNDKKVAAKRVAQDVEKAKQTQLERLRQALTPHLIG